MRNYCMTGQTSPQHIVIPFSDDSTLIFATMMRDCLRLADPKPKIELARLADEDALSERQMRALLPEGPDLVLTQACFEELFSAPALDAIITNRIFRALSSFLKESSAAPPFKRPAIIGFLGALEFFPEEAWYRRRNCDGVFLFPRAACDQFQAMPDRPKHQRIGFGHPAFLKPEHAVPEHLPEGDICFFTQAISPFTRTGRKHMLNIMIALAHAYPERRVRLKLRHLPEENRRHKHKERFDYPSLMASSASLPSNLGVTVCPMAEAIRTTALGITCTSTAAIDLIREGIPTMVHLDYIGNYNDPLMPPMRALFAESNLITPLQSLLKLSYHPPEERWLSEMFCGRSLGQKVLDMARELRHPSSKDGE